MISPCRECDFLLPPWMMERKERLSMVTTHLYKFGRPRRPANQTGQESILEIQKAINVRRSLLARNTQMMIPCADIVFGIRVWGLIVVNYTGWAKIRTGTTDRAGNIDSFHARSPFCFWCLGMRVQSDEPVRCSIGHCSELRISQVRYLEKRDEKASLLSVPMQSHGSISSSVSFSNSRMLTSKGTPSRRIAARQPERSTLQGCGHGRRECKWRCASFLCS